MKGPLRLLMDFWGRDWSLSALLGLLVLVVFVIPALGALGTPSMLLLELVLSLILVSGTIAAVSSLVARGLVIGLASATLAIQWLMIASPGLVINLVRAGCFVVFLAMLAGMVLKQTLREGPITWHRVQGSVAVYLLLGVTWGFTYELVILLDPGAFQFSAPHDDLSPVRTKLIYFSIVTLTTTGYGDIIPVHAAARSLATLEAMVGQLFPAILIARLVAMELQYRQSRQRP